MSKRQRDIKRALQHVRYLRGTLIPDLRESGSDFMADDFERCCKYIERLAK